MDIEDLVVLLKLDDPLDGTLRELVNRYRTVRTAQAVLKVLGEQLEDDLAARMEKDVLWMEDGWLTRSAVKNERWTDDESSRRFRDDIARTVVQAVATDLATGEMDPMKRNVARATVDLLWSIVPAFTTVKQAGRRLGIDASEYRTATETNRVTFTEGSAPWSG